MQFASTATTRSFARSEASVVDPRPPTSAADVEALWRARPPAPTPADYLRVLRAVGGAPTAELRRRPVTGGEPFDL